MSDIQTKEIKGVSLKTILWIVGGVIGGVGLYFNMMIQVQGSARQSLENYQILREIQSDRKEEKRINDVRLSNMETQQRVTDVRLTFIESKPK